MITCSKIKREVLRMIKNLVRDYPCCFSKNISETIIEKWNNWQYKEEVIQKHCEYTSLLPLSKNLFLLNLDFLSGFGELSIQMCFMRKMAGSEPTGAI